VKSGQREIGKPCDMSLVRGEGKGDRETKFRFQERKQER
jgi:hypothetical protein